jgi:hypothetical protein
MAGAVSGFPDTALDNIGASYVGNPLCLRECAACRGDAARPAGAAMPNYRCYFLDSANHVAATELIDCENDAEVQTRA